MLADGFQKGKLQIVGLQECRSKEGGKAQIGSYQRVIPDVKGQAVGNVKLWFNTDIHCDAEDPKIVLAAGRCADSNNRAQVNARGSRRTSLLRTPHIPGAPNTKKRQKR